MNRCAWCCDNGINQKYHDEEWGIAVHEDIVHFEYLLMEVMQCGLNWTMMLNKRDIFRKCFANFDFNIVAQFDEKDKERILQTDGMIKSIRKINAIIGNAKSFIEIINEFASFDKYIWSFTNNQTYVYLKHHEGIYETKNELSDRLSKDLKKRGFKYLGSITVYSHLQACGIINDHEPSCWMYKKITNEGDIKYIKE